MPIPSAGNLLTGGLHPEKSHILVWSGSRELAKNGAKRQCRARMRHDLARSKTLAGLARSFEAVWAKAA